MSVHGPRAPDPFGIVDPWASEGGAAAAGPAPSGPVLRSAVFAGDADLAAIERGEATIGQGSRGTASKRVQEALAALGEPITPDGAYGPKTAAAVRRFQQSAGLRQTGSVDGATLRALDARLAARAGGSAGAPAAAAGDPLADLDLLGGATIRPRAARTTTITSRPQPPVRPPAEPPATPTSYDNWFIDADELEVPRSVRVYLDRALAGDDQQIHALRELDLNLASPAEKAKLIGHLLDGETSGADERRILHLLSRKPAETPAILEALGAKGRLAQLIGDFSGTEQAQLLKILPKAVGASGSCELAASLVTALAASDTRERRLGAHHVFDAARAGGFLDDTLTRLRRTQGANAVVLDLVGQAKPTRTPNIIAHRGLPTEHPENTMPAIRAAMANGANALEIDVTITGDGQLVLWHDYDQGGIVPVLRNFGLESGMGFRPILPGLGTDARRPVHDLDLATFRRHFGYAPRDAGIGTDQRADVEIPLMSEVAAYAKANPDLEEIVVDVKLPPDRPDLHAKFARELDRVLSEHGIEKKVTILHNDAGVVRNLKRGMGPEYAFSHDVEIVSLAPDADDYSGARSARALGNTVASIGRPRIGINAYDTYLEALRRDRRAIDGQAQPTRLVTWTINDELELREVLAIGVDGIITDDPKLLDRLLDIYGLER